MNIIAVDDNGDLTEALLVAMYRKLQLLEAEHKVSRMNAQDLNRQLSEAVDRERDLADEVAMTRRSLGKAMSEFEKRHGDEIAIEAEGQIITRGLFSFIRRRLIRDPE